MINYPVKSIVLFFIVGIITGEYLHSGTVDMLLAAIIFFLFASVIHFMTIRNRVSVHRIFIYFLIMGSFLSGGAALQSFEVKNRIQDFIPFDKIDNFRVNGVVEEISLLRGNKFDFTIALKEIEGEECSAYRNKLIIRVKDKSQAELTELHRRIEIGDVIETRGTYIKPPDIRNPGEFNYREYLNRKGVTGFIYASSGHSISIKSESGVSFVKLINNFRKEIGYKLDKLHDKQTAGFLKGLILGDRSEIDGSLMRDFMHTGLVHIIAISGLHIIVISFILFFALQRLHIKIRFVLTGAALIFVMLITGAPAPVVRAVLMAILGMVAVYYNRSREILNIVALSALISLLVNPDDLFTPGFQLSYGAVLGLVVIYSEFRKRLNFLIRLPSSIRWVAELVLATILVQLAILPLTNYYFGIFSIMSVPANIIAVPLSNILVANGLVTLIISFISSQTAALLALTNNLLTYILFYIVQVAAGISWAYIPLGVISLKNFIILSVSVIAFAIFIRKTSNNYAAGILTALFILTLIVFSKGDISVFSEGKMSVMMADVGQGDSFLIRTPGGKYVMIDAGRADENYNSGDRVIIPLMERMNIPRIDLAIMSHTDADHFGGFTALAAAGKLKKVLTSRGQYEGTQGKKIRDFFLRFGVETKEAGDSIISIDGIRMYILNNNIYGGSSGNDNSLIVKVVYGSTSFLFTGDAGKNREIKLAADYGSFLKSDVLKVSHHGSKSGTSPAFLKYVRPEISLISVGKNNFYGHPSDEVLKNLSDVNSRILRTDQLGAVILISDGKKITEVSWR